ncbi:lipoprotein-anchoring transpeptidase ErfK/SrfK [Enterovirga rhinocerotis]|uniref:Lipoprotein-anchoring transpeptidase ErfK/SrfK n=1 Tax=Enterovirga rhinocerotis TaxID=1339210 RepID=A0A4R7BRE5_9HYPH|nr:lipoprotein-anchoring transpeptidase ErfK/SrfK [Enterovirga rhinocerotis]
MLLALTVSGCIHAGVDREVPPPVIRNAAFAPLYDARPDERFAIPATDVSHLDPDYLRQEVAYPRAEEPGTVVVDTGSRHLYLVQEGGRAIRYGIGVGKAGLSWAGRARVGRKAEWPRWTPTAAMIAREPERNGPWRGGMAAGLSNPLGARALYLYQGDRDTLYRIHGTNEPDTIGLAVSSGCIRMFNQDIIHLYQRVPVGAKVVVLSPADSIMPEPPMEVAAGDFVPNEHL